MAATVATVQAARLDGFIAVTDVTLDNSYAEGGEAVSAEQLGLASVDFAICSIVNGSESEEWVAEAFYKGGKVHLISAKTGKEVAGTKDMSKVVVRVFAFGKARAK
jgi:hypothetical protein